ncbi:MAG: PAS domain-containing sensor histidine kinase [Deltaproteobacteria bacterium]|nr:PAS domain-containing sensor histidine kinase [Deltaproteobacteria bacterium]
MLDADQRPSARFARKVVLGIMLAVLLAVVMAALVAWGMTARWHVLAIGTLGMIIVVALVLGVLQPMRSLYEATQEAVRRKDEALSLLDGLFACAPFGISVLDKDMRFVRVNEVIARIDALPEEEHVGRAIHEVLPPTLAAQVLDRVGQCFKTGEPILDLPMSVILPSAPAQLRHFMANSFPVRTPEGRVIAVATSVQEVTESMQGERRKCFLAEASSALAESFDTHTTLKKVAALAVPSIVEWCVCTVLGRNGRLEAVVSTHADPTCQPLLDELSAHYPVDHSAPHGLGKVLATGEPEFLPLVTEEMLAAVLPPACALLATRLRLRSCITVPMLAQGRVIGAISLVNGPYGRPLGPSDLDMATLLAQRAALAIENARLHREAQEALDSLSMGAHELKSPLCSLLLNAQMLERSIGERPVERRIVEEIFALTKRMTTLVNYQLDNTKIGAGKLVLEPGEVDLVTLVRDVADRFQRELGQAGCSLALHVPDHPVVMILDRLRVEQVVTNLMTNAMKYGKGKPIDLGVHEQAGRAVLFVRDRGVGIAPADQARIFGRFVRVHAEEKFSGTGLGLWIARRLVEALGGQIRVESEAGKGATFTVELPPQRSVGMDSFQFHREPEARIPLQ